MSLTRARASVFATFSACGILAGCNGAPEDQPVSSAATKTHKDASKNAAALPPEFVAAVAPGKSGALISVHFALGNAPTVGHALPVAIVIVPHREFLSIRAHFEAHDGLTLTQGADFGPSKEASPDKLLKHELTLMPSKDGLYMVAASVETEDNDGSVTRVFSIPVIVNPAPAPPAPAPAPAPSNTAPTTDSAVKPATS